MSYATQADLEQRFGAAELAQLTDPLAGVAVNAATLARALADADAEIDARLAVRWALPLAGTPAVLVRLAADIARYFLWDARASEQVRQRYKDAIRLLDQIAAGEVLLGGAEPLALAAGGAGMAVAARSPARTFSDELLGRFELPS